MGGVMAVVDLIQETIAQHIANPKVISYGGTKKDEVQGRFVAANRVYNFVLDRKGVSYSPAGRQDSLVFSALFLERLDAVKRPKIGDRVGNNVCRSGKSYQCGKTCISNLWNCRKGVKDVNDARRIASILASTNERLKASVKVSNKAQARGKALSEARKKREKVLFQNRLSDIGGIPESIKPWFKSIENIATPELVAIANKMGAPKVAYKKASAYYSTSYKEEKEYINMPPSESLLSFNARIVFLHEYGHYLDDKIGTTLHKSDVYVSSSPKGRKALLADEQFIINKSNLLSDEIKALNSSDENALNKVLDRSSKYLDIVFKKDESDDEFSDITNLLAKESFDENKNKLKGYLSKGSSLSKEDLRGMAAVIDELDVYHPDYTERPMFQVKKIDKPMHDFVMDLFGAITKNKVGYGHSDDYYKMTWKPNTEAFANIIAIANSGDEKAIAVAKKFAPNMWKFVMDSIKV